MDVFMQYLKHIENTENRMRTQEILQWVTDTFPTLNGRIAWNQPMFTDHGTYIIGFSVSKNHLAVAPEREEIVHFAADIQAAGYTCTKMLFRIKWEDPVDFGLLERIIRFTIQDKADCTTFWRR